MIIGYPNCHASVKLRKTLRISIEDLGRFFSLLKPQYKTRHHLPFTSLLQSNFPERKNSLNPNCSSSSSLSSTMADSSSVHATSHILPIRPQQCLIIDLTPHAYHSYMFPIIECLKYSPIAPALSRAESVPME